MKTSWFITFAMYCLLTNLSWAQTLTLEEAVQTARTSNAGVKAASLRVQQQQQNVKASFELPKTQATFLYGNYNSVYNDNNITVLQTFPFPVTLARQVQWARTALQQAQSEEWLREQQVVTEVKSVFYTLLYLKELIAIRTEADSIFKKLAHAANIRYRTGEGTLLEKASAEGQHREIQLQLLQAQTDYAGALSRLAALVNGTVQDVQGALHELPALIHDTVTLAANPIFKNELTRLSLARAGIQLERAKLWPEIQLGYFNQTIRGWQNVNGTDIFFGPGTRFGGLQAGVTLPLWFLPSRQRIKAAQTGAQAVAAEVRQAALQIQARWRQLANELAATRLSLTYYREQGLPTAKLLIEQSDKAFRAGEISYTTALVNAQQALRMREDYISTLNKWNQLVIEAEFLSGINYENR
jgi:cobalt-zinc-cadmium resistance protein CzcA